MARRPYPAVPVLTGALVALNSWLLWAHRMLTDAIGDYDSLDARLDAITDSIGAGVAAHASSHIRGASDEVDGDLIDVDLVPTNYTRTTDGTATSTEHLRAHLNGVDSKLGSLQTSVDTHASRHIHGGADVIDGDRLDVDYTPANYARTPGSNGTVDNDELTSHLDGIDDAMLVARTETHHGRVTAMVNTAAATSYAVPIGRNEGASITSTIADGQILFGRAGTLTNFRVQQLTSSGDADTYTLALNIDGSDTALSIAGIAGTDTSVHVDTSTVSITATSLLTVAKTNDGATLTNDITWSFDFIASL